MKTQQVTSTAIPGAPAGIFPIDGGSLTPDAHGLLCVGVSLTPQEADVRLLRVTLKGASRVSHPCTNDLPPCPSGGAGLDLSAQSTCAMAVRVTVHELTAVLELRVTCTHGTGLCRDLGRDLRDEPATARSAATQVQTAVQTPAQSSEKPSLSAAPSETPS